MTSLAIRCHPCVPVSISELESWLEQELESLRSELGDVHVRFLRLTQPLPSSAIPVGWLLEWELPGAEQGVLDRRLLATLTDMRLLGLQPTLLRPAETPDGLVDGGLAPPVGGPA